MPEKPVAWYLYILRGDLFVLLGSLTVLVISYFFHPQANPVSTLCGIKTALGLPCPACGLTRSFCSMAKLDLWAAFNFNILGPILFICTILLAWISLLSLFGYPNIFEKLLAKLSTPTFFKFSLYSIGIFWISRILYLWWTGTLIVNLHNGQLFR